MVRVPSIILNHTAMKTQRLVLVVLLLALLAPATYFFLLAPMSDAERIRTLNEAESRLRKEQFTEAFALATKVMKADPETYSAFLVAGQACAGLDDLSGAVRFLEQVPQQDLENWREAQLLLARLHQYRTFHIAKALECYRNVLQVEPDHPESNLGLAHLLSISARVQDSIPFVLKSIQLNVEEKLPLLLLFQGSVIRNRDYLEQAKTAAPEDPHPLLGEAWHLLEDEKFDEAIVVLRQAVDLAPDLPAAWDALGSGLLKAERYDELPQWLHDAPEEIGQYAGAWRVRAEIARRNTDQPGSVRCLIEAARIQPTDRTLLLQLQRELTRLEDHDVVARVAEQVEQMTQLQTQVDRMFSGGGERTHAQLVRLCDLLADVGRYWEAYSWGKLAYQSDPSDKKFSAKFKRIADRCRDLPMIQTVESQNLALAISVDQYPVPQATFDLKDIARNETALNHAFRFEVAEAGMDFEFLPGFTGEPQHRMFEFTGGGLGVCDFDQDGAPDVYCSQGNSDWTQQNTTESDALFWNRSGREFIDVAPLAGIRELQFGQGVCCGDLNSDGFPDIYVANIGQNTLWLNNGDGTFTNMTAESGVRNDQWTTSCLVADLNGDGHPDLYDVNYVTGDDVFERTCKSKTGEDSQCRPFDFESQVDAVWLNDGQGKFLAGEDLFAEKPIGKGLGIAAWDADGSGRLSVFVANDTTPNLFHQPVGQGDDLQFVDNALAAGLAINWEGKAEACMGVAVGDVDQNGHLDVHVTNFFNESNTFYMANSAGLYDDRTRETQLQRPTWEMLAFGTAFLDANLDGNLELFVANGHLEASQAAESGYHMPPDYFAWTGASFQKVSAETLGPYFQAPHVGRGVAILDWNLDGRPDLLVGQREEPNRLLTNTTADVGNCLIVKLIGCESARDAYGATVKVRIGKTEQVHQLVAGGGYHSNHEKQLFVGCGSAQIVDGLTVTWPSEKTQFFRDISLPCKIALVQNASEALRMPFPEKVAR